MLKTKEKLLDDVFNLAKANVADCDILDFSLAKGRELASVYHVSCDIVFIGMCLMDLKLQEAKALGKINEHISMALLFAEEFLKNYDLTDEEYQKILSCIANHHGATSFEFIEAEICANADCYIFIHPKGVFTYSNLLAKRQMSLCEQVKQLSYKLEEKYHILTLDRAKEELEEYYQMFIKIFREINLK